MSGSATLTMKRSRLASTTPAQTMTRTVAGEASRRRSWLRERIASSTVVLWLRDVKVRYAERHDRADPPRRPARRARRVDGRQLLDRPRARRRPDEVGDARPARGVLRRVAVR